MKKLIEETVAELEDIGSFSVTDEFFPSREEYLREVAQRFIARIGKAYADGELELPDEVGRITFHGLKEGQRLEDLRFKMGDTLIALRAGTGREEEK